MNDETRESQAQSRIYDSSLCAVLQDLERAPTGSAAVIDLGILYNQGYADTTRLLVQSHRVLGTHGVLRFEFPSLLLALSALQRPEHRHWSHVEHVLDKLFPVAPDDVSRATGFTASLMVEYLAAAGFVVNLAEYADSFRVRASAVKFGSLMHAEDRVHNAYFELFGRPVDEAGLRFHADRLRSGELDETTLRLLLKSSEEYRQIAHAPAIV